MNSFKKQPRQGRLKQWLNVLYRMAVVGLVSVSLIAAGGGIYFAYQWLDKPIEVIRVKGEFTYLQPGELEALVEPLIDGGIVSLNLEQINRRLEQHVWIKQANVSRQWGNGLLIEVIEETPIARWKTKGFLNSTGELLTIEDNSELSGLTLLDGPEGQAAEVMKRYREVAELLASRKLQIAVMHTDESGIWHMQLDNGLELMFGRSQLLDKVRRFLRAWDDSLSTQAEQMVRVDLRYSNGLAVAWKQPAASNG